MFHPDLPPTLAATDVAATVLLVDVEPALAALYAEWLRAAGIPAVRACRLDAAAAPADAAIVELPFPRLAGAARIARLAEALPGVPLVALSPGFHAGVASHGALARELGVHAVVAPPVRCDALVAAVASALGVRG